MRRFGVVFLFLTIGCSLITDVGSLQTGGDSGPQTDAQTMDAPIADAGTDTSMMMGSDAEAGPKGFCASQPAVKLCEDFDTGLFSAKFSSLHQNGMGTIGSSATAFQSSPNAFLAQVPASDAGAGSAYMQRVFIGMASSVSYAFDLRPEAWTTGGKSVVLGGVTIDDGLPSEHTLNFYVTDSYAAVEEIYKVNNVFQFDDHALTMHPMLGKWSHVVMTVDMVARTAKVELDGGTVLTTGLVSTWAPGTPTCDLGISYVASTAMPWTMRYDNVVFDFK